MIIEILLMCELLLLICNLPNATAYGLVNNNLLNSITSALMKAVDLEFKSKPQVVINSTRSLSSKAKLQDAAHGRQER